MGCLHIRLAPFPDDRNFLSLLSLVFAVPCHGCRSVARSIDELTNKVAKEMAALDAVANVVCVVAVAGFPRPAPFFVLSCGDE